MRHDEIVRKAVLAAERARALLGAGSCARRGRAEDELLRLDLQDGWHPDEGTRRRRMTRRARQAAGGAATPVGVRSIVEVFDAIFPSGRVQVATRPASMVRAHPPSWTRWWCRVQIGTRLSMSASGRMARRR